MSDKTEQPLFWPRTMLQQIQSEAIRLDRSLSWCVQRAWQTSRDALAGAEADVEADQAQVVFRERYGADDAKVMQPLFFPLQMLREIKDASVRRDRSVSWLVQQAWCLACDEIAALPSTD